MLVKPSYHNRAGFGVFLRVEQRLPNRGADQSNAFGRQCGHLADGEQVSLEPAAFFEAAAIGLQRDR
ncbi:hypothetical protein BKA01_004821 [Pseudonocardia eucalypti]|uniref:hypothetical protein n=1 Tax=Pseudonocardia eucalypti TaxID=648755 RepID=UPI00160B69C7|nr:hypothetical protein [Pseudonocardia eucalypti]